MSDQELPPLPPNLASLLDAEKDRPDPTSVSQDRLLSRLEASIASLPPGPGGGGHGGDGGGGASGGGQAASGAAAKSAAGLSGKASIGASLLAKPIALAVGTFVLGGAVGAVIDHASVKPEPQQTKIVYVDRVVQAPSADATTLAPALSSSAPAPQITTTARVNVAPSPSAASSSAAPQGHDAELAGERALIEIARTALGKGDYNAALEAASKHAAKYPHGQLTEEREALAIEALVGAGKMDEAKARGARFKHDFPNSMVMPVVDSVLR